MFRYFLVLSYNGTGYSGWQLQQNAPRTIQQALQDYMKMIFQHEVDLTGCGRTDRGVNAKNYVAHFDSPKPDLVEKKQHWIYKLNSVLPKNIAVHDILKVREDAHARFDATQRVYYYYLTREKNPFRDAFTWYVHGDLDFDLMNELAQLLTQYKDFACFTKSKTQTKTTICHISKAGWIQCGPYEWRFEIMADRFLRGMVRAIVGTLVMAGQHKINKKDFIKIIESEDRRNAGNNAPPSPLFLTGVKYPKDIYID